MLDLQQLQHDVHEWSVYNFGDQSAENSLCGLIEEVGELAHAWLKTNQKIRGPQADMTDAIGDIVIYLMDYTARIGFKMPPQTRESFYGVAMYKVSIPYIANAIGMITNNYIHGTRNKAPSSWQVGYLLSMLATFCANNHLDFEAAIIKTWSEVRLRDWKQFPTDGRTH